MAHRRAEKSLARDSHQIAALWIVIAGLVMILASNTFEAAILKLDLDAAFSNIGALLLITGVLQWLFDAAVRRRFFNEIRTELIDGRGVADSGICEFHAHSKDVNFREMFITSSSLIVGVNYSAKLIDDSIELLGDRVRSRKDTIIICVAENTLAEQFLEDEYNKPNIPSRIAKIKQVIKDNDPRGEYIKLIQVPTILRYSFIEFDSRIWIIPGTNGLGRRAVPGFFVRHGTPWFKHYKDDIDLLRQRGVPDEFATSRNRSFLGRGWRHLLGMLK